MILIGYSGHAFVVCGILQAAGKKVTGYCEKTQKDYNPFSLEYLGDEVAAIESLVKHPFFIAIGDNAIREKIFLALASKNCLPINAIHPSAVVDPSAVIATNAVMIAANATIKFKVVQLNFFSAKKENI